ALTADAGLVSRLRRTHSRQDALVTERSASRFAPSSKVALYIATVIALYLIQSTAVAVVATALLVGIGISGIRKLGVSIPIARWRAVFVLILWVLVMRVLLDLVGGKSLADPAVASQA